MGFSFLYSLIYKGMSRKVVFDDLNTHLLPKGEKATSRMSLSGFLGRQNRQSKYQEDQRQSYIKPSKPLKGRVLSALGLRTPLKTDRIDKKIMELTGILKIYEKKELHYINSESNNNKIKMNLEEQIAGYKTYKDNINKATTEGNLEYILPDFQKLEEKLTVLQKMGELYDLRNFLKNKSYWNETYITKEKKKLVSNFVLVRIKASIKTLKTSDNLDTFKEPISDDDYNMLYNYLTTDTVNEIPLQILNDYELGLLFKELANWFRPKDRTISELALLLVEINNILQIHKGYIEIKSERITVNKLKDELIYKIKAILVKKNPSDADFINALKDLGYLLAEDILQFEELLELELLTDDILTIKDLNDILTKEDLIELKGLLENYEHSELKDLQMLKELYDNKDAFLISMLKDVEYHVNGGRKASVKKEICGKLRCIYKISGSRKEHVKYKGRLITVADYKRIHKIRKA
jgi:hypothetical protein